jgi:hypothetical protein
VCPGLNRCKDSILISGVFEYYRLIAFGSRKDVSYKIPICDIDSVFAFSVWKGQSLLCIHTVYATIRTTGSRRPYERKSKPREYPVIFETNNAKAEEEFEEYRQVVFIPFQVNREPNLVKRINDAIQHYKTFCNEKPKEAF